VADWLNRSDLTSQVPDFITLAEIRVNRNLRTLGMENRATATLASGQEYYALPTDFLEARNVQINDGTGVNVLDYRSPQQIDVEYSSSVIGTPKVYTIIGCEIQLKPVPDSAETLEIAYFQKPDPLSDTNATNWLVTNTPDLLLYGALMEAEPFLKNDKRLPVWQSLYQRGIDDINRQDKIARYSGSTLKARGDSYRP
jgi:hypothetical protein